MASMSRASRLVNLAGGAGASIGWRGQSFHRQELLVLEVRGLGKPSLEQPCLFDRLAVVVVNHEDTLPCFQLDLRPLVACHVLQRLKNRILGAGERNESLRLQPTNLRVV